jgi:adenylate cyclase
MRLIGPDSSFDVEHHRNVILVLDTVESVRLMESDERGFIERWLQFTHDARHVVAPACMGVYRKSTGDGFMLEFEGAPEAVEAAFELRRLAAVGNLPLGQDAHMHVRIALHLADYVADGFDIYGSGVNLASRLLSLARPGDIVASAPVRDLITGTGATVEDMGVHQLRHLRSPAQVYRLLAADPRTGNLDAPAPAREGEPG